MKIIPVIMSGGAGARLWPVSREKHPKPFFRLDDEKSLIQHAFLRASVIANANQILTITNQEFFFKTEDEYRKLNLEHITRSYILEPEARDTAAAAAAVSLFVQENHGDDAIVVLFPADHLIQDIEAFQKTALHAVSIAAKGHLVTFGIKPTYPETGYGYIEADGEKVVRFVEKPNLEKAREYVSSGNFLWNSGIFCFPVGVMVALFQKHCPDILEQTRQSIEAGHISSVGGGVQLSLDKKLFSQTRKDSIDYAVLEREDDLFVIACNIGWTDIGSWNAVSELTPPDHTGNRVSGDAILLETKNCYIHESNRLIGTIGVENLLIIDTEDALLISHKDRAQDVKTLYTQLKEKGHPAYNLHQTVYRPWGSYTILEKGERFKIKRIVVKPGASLSLQLHHHRSEHWVVVSGTARIINGDDKFYLSTNESTYIPSGRKHRLENPGIMELVIIEMQIGDYLGEDDIIRFED